MLDGLLLKPAVTVPFCRSSVSKHLDGVYLSGNVLRKKLCGAQLAITTRSVRKVSDLWPGKETGLPGALDT